MTARTTTMVARILLTVASAAVEIMAVQHEQIGGKGSQMAGTIRDSWEDILLENTCYLDADVLRDRNENFFYRFDVMLLRFELTVFTVQ